MNTIRLITFSRPLALIAAEHKGFFAREGLQVECEITRGSVEQIRGLLSGSWDVAHTAADNVMAYDDKEQADLFIFLVADLGLSQKLIVRPDISSYDDLRGKTLGVDALDTGYAFVLRSMLHQNGVQDREFELVSVGGTPQRLAAMREGRIAGALLSAPPDEGVLPGGYRLLDPANRYFPNYPGLTATVTRRWANAHEEELVGYTRALLEGARWAADPRHTEEGVELIARDQGVDLQTARQRLSLEEADRSNAAPTLEEIRQGLEVVRALRRQITGVGSDLDAYFDPRYMQRAQEQVRA